MLLGIDHAYKLNRISPWKTVLGLVFSSDPVCDEIDSRSTCSKQTKQKSIERSSGSLQATSFEVSHQYEPLFMHLVLFSKFSFSSSSAILIRLREMSLNLTAASAVPPAGPLHDRWQTFHGWNGLFPLSFHSLSVPLSFFLLF